MKKIYLSAALLLSGMMVQAQFTYNYLKAADNYYSKGDYSSASNYYEKYLTAATSKTGGDNYDPYVAESLKAGSKSPKGSSSRVQAVYNLAESYRKLTYYSKAEPFYKEATAAGAQAFPLAQFHYAGVLKKLEKYADAEAAYQEFLKNYATADNYTAQAKQELESLRFIQAQLKKEDAKLYTVTKPALNAEGATYAPVWLNDNTLLFTSTRADKDAAKNTLHTNRVYEAAYNSAAEGAAKAGLPQPAGAHQGVVSVSADGRRMYITRWTVKDGQKSAAIYRSDRTGENWSDPVALEASVNEAGTNNQQPFISADGTYLLFASDRKSGQGGYDIWMAEMDASGHAGKVQNLGTAINTAADEQAPYYHATTRTLVFSSNGRIGMGGYDLYSAKGTPGQWAAAKNMGYPVNSVKDDMYFAAKGNTKNLLADVLISSDRSSACCLEIVAVQKKQPARVVSGIVIDCGTGSPLANAEVALLDTVSGRPVGRQQTNAEGRYSFTLEEFQPLKVIATVQQYEQGSVSFTAPGDEEVVIVTNPSLCLVKVPAKPELEVGKAKVMEHVYYELNKATVLDESKGALDELVQLLTENPAMTIEISGHTDSIGRKAYNRKLSQQRADNVVAYLVSKGIDAARLKAVGYGDTVPVAPNSNEDGSDNAEGRKQNRRTEFKVLSK